MDYPKIIVSNQKEESISMQNCYRTFCKTCTKQINK